MSLGQALAAAIDGLGVTQSGMALIAANVANSGTPGYSAKTQSLDTITTGGLNVGVDVAGVNRQLDDFVRAQLRTESSGGSYADIVTQIYQQLQQALGAPSASTSLQATYANFTGAMQNLAANPSDYSAQVGVINAAQGLAAQLNSLTSSVQQLRSSAEQGLSDAVTTANGLLKTIADVNTRVASLPANDATAASLLDQRDLAIDKLATLMDIRVVPGSANQVTVFTASGLQLAGTTASVLSFNAHGTLTAGSQWNADPAKSGVGTITLTSPNNGTVDLVATNAIRAGQIGAYLAMRDRVLPQAQSQLDQIAATMSSALSDYQTAGTAVTSGGQAGFDIGTANLVPGNKITVGYTTAPGNTPHTLTIVNVNDPTALPLPSPDPNNPVVGVDFSGGMAKVVSQLNSILGSPLQFSNPSGTTLRVLDRGPGGGVSINAATSTATQTGLAAGMSQLPLFTDGSAPFSGAITGSGPQTLGFAGRIAVNPALAANPASLVAFQSGTASGDPTRPNFLVAQLNSATFTFSPSAGIGSTNAPFNGTLSSYVDQVLTTQGAAAASAKSLSDGQDVVVNSLQQSFNSATGVNIDNEMASLLALQNAYTANARVLTTINQMFTTLQQAFGP
jgi:flagellar hook-associated protein 1 FlgK